MNTVSAPRATRRQLVPFAVLSASYFAHIGFFNPYLPLWLQELGLSILAISVLVSVQAATRLFAPYGWGWLSDRTGERIQLMRYSACAALLAAVTPLLREAQRWPAYTRATRQVSATAQAIRQALFNARAHDALLFEALPQACGVPPFAADAPADPGHVDAFFAGLRAGLLELQAARTTLADRVEAQLAAAFGVAAPDRTTLHATLRRRAAPLVPLAHDPLVRAFLLRLDHETAWLESVAALVARRPLDAWADADAERFATAVRDLARRFQLAEELALLAGQLPADAAVLRLGLADPRGERSSVFDARDCDDQLLAALRQTLDLHAAASHRTLATLATVLMELLQPVHQEPNDAE